MTAKPIKQRVYSAIKYIILLAVAALLLWASFRGVHWDDFVTGLKSANYWWIMLSMAIGVLAFFLRALRWRLIMLPLGKKIRRKDAWHGINIGYITNFAIPRAGEFARCGVISKKTGLPFETVAGTVVLERSIDLLALIITTFAVLIFHKNKFAAFINREIIDSIGDRFSNGIFWIAGALALSFIVFLFLVYRLREHYPFFRKIANVVKGVLSGVVSGFRMNQKWLFLFYTVAINVCYWLMSYTTILAFSAVGNLGASDALFLMVIGGFGWVVPVQGGIGAYHFIISLALTTIYGIDQTTGVVFATISHESQALTMIIFGIISLLSLYLPKPKFVSK